MTEEGLPEPVVVGRYALYGEIAAGGMASVHYGRLRGAAGFSRTVAVKRLHPQFAKDPEFAAQFLDEARLAARIQHPNVVQTLDVVAHQGELLLVLEYIAGETLSSLMRRRAARGARIPTGIAAGIMCGALHGLHAAHEARDDAGCPLEIVHRDVSPQNIMLGRDGVPRVLDFGVAKAAQRAQSTEGQKIKGKVRYMAPEQVMGHEVDRRTDVFAAGVVLWELVVGERLFGESKDMVAVLQRVISMPIPRARERCPELSPALEQVLARALERNKAERYSTAEEMALALEAAVRVPPPRELALFLEEESGPSLAERARDVAKIAQHASTSQLRVRASFVDVMVDASALVRTSSADEDDDGEWGTERVTGGGWLSKQDEGAAAASCELAAAPSPPQVVSVPRSATRRSRAGYFALGALLAAGAVTGAFALSGGAREPSGAASAGITQGMPSVRDVLGGDRAPVQHETAAVASADPDSERASHRIEAEAKPGTSGTLESPPPRTGGASVHLPPRAAAGVRPKARPGNGRPKLPPTRPAVTETDPLSRRK